jgi:hypothetical protein
VASPLALAGANPSSAKITVYGVAVSSNTDCSNAKVIGYNASGTTYDLLSNPTLVTGNVDPGTYQCVILYMSSVLTFVPATTTGNCTAGTTYQRVICSQSNGCTFTQASPDSSNILQFTGTANASASDSQDTTHADKVLLFLSTASTGTGGTDFLQPTSGNLTNGLPLSGAFTVAASGTQGTFVIDFDGQVDGTQNPCDLGPPTFSFR